jgi:hypothetical protein
MVASRQHRPRRQLRRCIFCGGGGIRGNKMSEEHTWSMWMHPFLPKFENPIKDLGYTALSFTDMRATRSFFSRQGHAYSETFKVVCERCNNGWMGQIEEAAKPILIPLIQAQQTSLFRNNRKALAEWIALKAIVIDSAHAEDAVLSGAYCVVPG